MKGMSEEYYQRLIKDLNLRIDNLEFQRNMKQEKIEQLQSNWNSLREWVIEQKDNFFTMINVQVLLEKMNELEGGKNE